MDDAEENVANVDLEEEKETREARAFQEKAATKVDLFKINSCYFRNL